MTSAQPAADTDLVRQLVTGPLDVEGRLPSASNLTVRCTLVGTDLRCVYKPTVGERPLWDFPDGTLGRREVATYCLASAVGWPVVPLTVWREDGPLGPGMCQLWLDGRPDLATDQTADQAPDQVLVDIVPSQQIPPGWLHVFDGIDQAGQEVSLIHADRVDLQQIVLLDAIVNNADRKGGHLLLDAEGRAVGIDHGVTFAASDKLRTVLWGWAGTAIPSSLINDLQRGFDAVCALELVGLSSIERHAMRSRLETLLAEPVFPLPTDEWPSIPWPIF
jgi:uncharacterized repeat protein (TIGR03843 family)